MKRILLLTVIVTTFLTQACPAAEFSDAAVGKAINKAKGYLWSKYQDDPKDDPWPDKRTKKSVRDRNEMVPYENYGGKSALVMYALLSAGADVNDPRMKRALDWLSRIDAKGTYTVSLRIQTWSMLPAKIGLRPMVKDAAKLLKGIYHPVGRIDPAKRSKYGTYTYDCTLSPSGWSRFLSDHSNTWFGTWGVATAADSGVEIPRAYWQLVYDHWKSTWRGGWSYVTSTRLDRGRMRTRDSMTAGGMLIMLNAYDQLYAAKTGKSSTIAYEPIAEAEKWFNKNFQRKGDYEVAPAKYYAAHVLHRAALAGGHRLFGDKDWYKTIAAQLLTDQQADGSWKGVEFDGGDAGATAFALLFLVNARRPVLFNKLQLPGLDDTRPRDVALATKWINKHLPVKVAWQKVTFEMELADWLDAPILYISSLKDPKFSDEQVVRLREYTQKGGAIFAVPQGRSLAFGRAMEKLYAKLLPDRTLQVCPRDHEIYSSQFKLPGQPKLSLITDELRPLVVHSTTDIGKGWLSTKLSKTNRSAQAAANVFMYVTGGQLRNRGTSSP